MAHTHKYQSLIFFYQDWWNVLRENHKNVFNALSSNVKESVKKHCIRSLDPDMHQNWIGSSLGQPQTSTKFNGTWCSRILCNPANKPTYKQNGKKDLLGSALLLNSLLTIN